MIHIVLPEEDTSVRTRLPFYLAAEEWVARCMPAGDYFFSWQVDPTVICGRNQEIDKEVNLEYCSEHGIDVVRRRSGGGCVFADRDNYMFSFITANDNVERVFAMYNNMIADKLQELGFNATVTGRNDICIEGKKVAGNAFYHLPGRSIAHGTMLYSFNPTMLANAITPSKAKLESKGVKSVPKRVTCLKDEGIRLTPSEFRDFIVEGLTMGNKYFVSPEEVSEIKKIEQHYYDPDFLRIHNDRMKSRKEIGYVIHKEHIPGLGEFCVEYDVKGSTPGEIANFTISGDFFMQKDVETLLCKPMNGTELLPETVREKINGINPQDIIDGLTEDLFYRLVIGE